ncbi:type IV secretory system conjugative DNA transfer family protein [Listeria booriae]|uniref:type IV secretory system conjugative DNA transfer family protein n=1 Tax=Listeria booriae TaxID=1552123 RepID=UPI001625A4B8|nr:type IV secretory system conjugative DNA transfer family protein [Listeria booriae]
MAYDPRKSRLILSASFFVKLGAIISIPMFFLINIIRVYFRSVLLSQPLEKGELLRVNDLSTTDLLFVYSIACLIVGIFIFALYRNLGDINAGAEGSRRFATLRELKKEYKIVPDRQKMFDGVGGFPISHFYKPVFKKEFPYVTRKGFLLIETGEANNQVLAPTRGGKGENIIKQYFDVLSRARDKASLVINDMKGELALACSAIFTKRGYRVLILNFIRPELGSIQINPLDDIRDAYEDALKHRKYLEDGQWKEYADIEDEEERVRVERDIRSGMVQEEIDAGVAVDLTSALCAQLIPQRKNSSGDDFWINSPRSLMAALILYICDVNLRKAIYLDEAAAEKYRAKVTLYTTAITLNHLGGSYEEKKKKVGMGVDKFNLLDKTFTKLPEGHPAKNEYSTSKFAGEAPQTRAGIFSGCANALTLFMKPSIAKITAKSTFRMEDLGFGDEPIALFMIMPEADKTYHALSSLYTSMIYQVLTRRCLTAPGQRCTRNVKFVLDEKGQMVPIENYSAMCSMGLGKGIDFMQALQDDNQLEDLYGREKANIIRQGMSNEFFIISKDKDTTERVSKEIGHTQIYTRTRGPGGSEGHVKRRRLLEADELAELMEGEAIVLRVTKRKDRKGRKIRPRPIFNTGKTMMPYAWKELPEFTSRDRFFEELPLDQSYKSIILGDLMLDKEIGNNPPSYTPGPMLAEITDPPIEKETQPDDRVRPLFTEEGPTEEKAQGGVVQTGDYPWEDVVFRRQLKLLLPEALYDLMLKRRSEQNLRHILKKLVSDGTIQQADMEATMQLYFAPEGGRRAVT